MYESFRIYLQLHDRPVFGLSLLEFVSYHCGWPIRSSQLRVPWPARWNGSEAGGHSTPCAIAQSAVPQQQPSRE
jgi:hypothetical protein